MLGRAGGTPLIGRRWSIAAWAAAALGLAAVLGGLEARLLEGRAAPVWDALDLHAPMQMLLADHARAHRFLLWDPWLSAGAPDFADPQTGSFSPISLAFGLATGGSTRGFVLFWLAHWLLGGLGWLALARRLGAPPWGGFVVALGWLFSGLYVGQAEHIPILVSFSWLPWIIVRLDAARAERRWLPGAQAGALWGLSALYGYPAMTFLGPVFALAWTAARALPRRGGAGAPLRVLVPRLALGGALLLVVGVVVLAPAYLGILYEARGYSDYTGAKTKAAAVASDALAPGAFATFASPQLAALKLRNPALFWPETDGTTVSVYAGAVCLVLALLALLGGWRDPFRLALVTFAAGAAVLAVGDALPLRGWLYDLVPPTRYFRHAALFRNYLVMCELGLAALGSADLEGALRSGDAGARRRLALAAGLCAVAALAVYAFVARRAPSASPGSELAGIHLLVAWGGLAALAGPDRAGRVPRRAVAVPAVLVAIALFDAAATDRLSPVICDERPGVVARWRAFDPLHETSLDLTPSGLMRGEATRMTGAVSSMGVALKLPTLLGYEALANRFQARWARDPVLAAAAVQSSGGRPRTWFAADAPELPLDDAAFDRFAARAERLGAPPLVVHSPEAMLALHAPPPSAGTAGATGAAGRAGAAPGGADAWPAADPLPVHVVRYEPDLLSIDVDAPRDGWLLVTDRWSRSWHASIDGTPVPLWGGDFLFRAVRVRAGPQRVTFRFAPPAWRGLLAASWGTLAAVAILSALAIPGRLRARERPWS
jgi:hypothetical protein